MHTRHHIGSTLRANCRHISNVPQTRGWERKIAEGPPCVVLASPGFVQSGPSRELLELWAPDPRNGLIVTGYSVEGTMARVSACRQVRSRFCSVVTMYVVSFEIMTMLLHHIHENRPLSLAVNLSCVSGLCAMS